MPSRKMSSSKEYWPSRPIVQGSVNYWLQCRFEYTQVEDVIISSNNMGQVKTKHASSGGSVQMTDALIGWRDLDLSFGLLNIKTNGELRNWQDKKDEIRFHSQEQSQRPGQYKQIN
jgi:hypothetical protein